MVPEPLPFDTLANTLSEKNWCVMENAFPAPLLNALTERFKQVWQEGLLAPAGIGRGQDAALNATLRRDHASWLSADNPTEKQLLDAMEILRTALNERLMLGLFDYEAHFALYEPGAFYRRHSDAFRGQKNRIVSTVLYLNPDWKESEGGELALYENEEAAEAFLRVIPALGTFVIFLSEEIPHEVLPANRARASIAGWFRVRQQG